MSEQFTPKQVALALQVSESSVKRWCDRGEIRTERTIGGHRRIALGLLLEFLESTNRRIVNPSAMGLEKAGNGLEHGSTGPHHSKELGEKFEVALIEGDENECRRILGIWYSNFGGIASIADNLICPAFSSVVIPRCLCVSVVRY